MYNKFISIMHRLEECFLVALFLVALVVLSMQVASRYVMTNPLAWSEELARFLFLWIVFFGAAYALREGGHVAVTMLVDKFNDKFRNAIYISNSLISMIFFIVVAYTGYTVALKVINLPTIAMGISSTWEYAAVPLACAVMAVRSLLIMIDYIKNGVPRESVQTLM